MLCQGLIPDVTGAGFGMLTQNHGRQTARSLNFSIIPTIVSIFVLNSMTRGVAVVTPGVSDTSLEPDQRTNKLRKYEKIQACNPGLSVIVDLDFYDRIGQFPAFIG